MGHLYTWNYRLSLSLKITSEVGKGQTQEWSLNVTLPRASFLLSFHITDTENVNYITALNADSLQDKQSQCSVSFSMVLDIKAETSLLSAQLCSAL